ncbi:MAG: S8 family serine peptidase [Actinobacteria bacterium]|nr:S8 family serine peptidase [Actinomycetota bacterium]
MPRRSRRLVLLLAVVSLATPAFVGQGPPALDPAPAVAGHVVVLDDEVVDVAAAADEVLSPLGVTPTFLYEHALRGFSVRLDARQAARVGAHPLVDLVERDRTFAVASTSDAVTVPTGVSRVGATIGVGSRIRIDADVAVLDTGVDAQHPDLRVHHRVDCTRPEAGSSSSSFLPALVTVAGSRRERKVCAPDRGDDDTGHGTHVAGVIGAKDDGRGVVGVAPGVRIWGVKVLDMTHGGGSTSEIVAGLDHVTEHAREIEVVNLSFVADGRSGATDRAVRGATRAGLVVVAAAGNAGNPASWYSPANAPTAITVSAITDLDGRPGGLEPGGCQGADDHLADYSNYGRAVSIAAPGSCILSTAVGGGTVRYSGTSVAAPHVAGVAARHIAAAGEARGSTRWERTRAALLERAAPQSGPCGFAGGRSAEPVLRLARC